MRNALRVIAMLHIVSNLYTQSYSPDSLRQYEVRASQTDGNISFELAKHFAWYNPTYVSNGTLLVYMPGTYDNPQNTTYFTSLAANNGYHVVNLKYPNNPSAQTPCRTSSDSNCYENFRKEIIEGIDYSPDIVVDTTNSITNRLLKLLIYLHNNNPSEGWNGYYSGSTINWNLTAVSGHSQGGGHAAVIAMRHQVKRVIMFASPNDYSTVFNDGAPWTRKPHITPDSAYYGFANLYDDVVDYAEQHIQWNDLNLPIFGDTIRINNSVCPYNNSHQLYTTDTDSGVAYNHSNMVRDNETPVDTAGKPVYEEVWKYLLGLNCPTTNINKVNVKEDIVVFPNPTNDNVTIKIPFNNQSIVEVQLHDISGKFVKSIVSNKRNVVMDLSTIPDGLYMLLVKYENNLLGRKKVIIQR